MSRYASLLPSVLPVAALILAGCAQTPQSPSTVAAPVLNTSLDPANCSKPVYPPQALARKIEGTSTIQFLLNAQGKVLESRVQKSSGDATLDEAARSALSKCTFKPPTYQGQPVQAWTAVQYTWKAD